MLALKRPTASLTRRLFVLFALPFGNIKTNSERHDEIYRPNLEMRFTKLVKGVEIGKSGCTNDGAALRSRPLNGCRNRIIRLGLSIGVAIFADVGSDISVTVFH